MPIGRKEQLPLAAKFASEDSALFIGEYGAR
jgi:hypothetical protein